MSQKYKVINRKFLHAGQMRNPGEILENLKPHEVNRYFVWSVIEIFNETITEVKNESPRVSRKRRKSSIH